MRRTGCSLTEPENYRSPRQFKDVLETLLEWFTESNVDLDARDYKGLAPLHYAAASNSFEAVKVLLAWGAKKDVTTIKDETPYDFALRNLLFSVARSKVNDPGVHIQATPRPIPLLNDKRRADVAESEVAFQIIRLLCTEAPGPVEDPESEELPVHGMIPTTSRVRMRLCQGPHGFYFEAWGTSIVGDGNVEVRANVALLRHMAKGEFEIKFEAYAEPSSAEFWTYMAFDDECLYRLQVDSRAGDDITSPADLVSQLGDLSVRNFGSVSDNNEINGSNDEPNDRPGEGEQKKTPPARTASPGVAGGASLPESGVGSSRVGQGSAHQTDDEDSSRFSYKTVWF
jgi:hypothetical protein